MELGLAAWLGAGVPASKIVLGVAAYGHGFSVAPSAAFPNGSTGGLNMFPAQNSSNRFQGSSWDNDPPVDDCGNAQPPSGTYQFWSMVTEKGFLTETGEPAANVTAGWDGCSQTVCILSCACLPSQFSQIVCVVLTNQRIQPALYDSARQIWVSYDNARSMAVKGQYILSKGLKGFAMWETGGDYKNILVDSVRAAVGMS